MNQCVPGQLSSCIDAWTSKIMTAYLAVTIHWIDKDWCLCGEILSFTEIESSHSGENMSEILYNVFKSYGILDKVCISFLLCGLYFWSSHWLCFLRFKISHQTMLVSMTRLCIYLQRRWRPMTTLFGMPRQVIRSKSWPECSLLSVDRILC